MTKTSARLIQVNLNVGNKLLACRLALLGNVENGSVYLDNAYDAVKHNISKSEWSGYLSALEAQGNYRPADNEHRGHFGYIK